MDASNRLVVLRGPSCAGKTTVASMLFESSRKKTVLIQQDHYRFIFNPAGGGSKPNSDVIRQMIEHNVGVSLSSGYDVILEGILSEKSYGNIIERIVQAHGGDSFLFYLNVSLKETLNRRDSKGEQVTFGKTEMTEWYSSAHRLGSGVETVIPESSTVEQTLGTITKATGW